MQGQIGPLLLSCQLLAAWFLGGHEDLDLGQRARQKAQVLQEPASRRQGIRRGIHHGLIMGAAAIRVAQAEDDKQSVDQQDIFHRVVFFLAALTCRLFSRVLGADDPPFCAVMGKRGDAGTATGPVATGVGSSSGATMVAASTSEPLSRWARAVRERAGASPRARSAASSAGRRT